MSPWGSVVIGAGVFCHRGLGFFLASGYPQEVWSWNSGVTLATVRYCPPWILPGLDGDVVSRGCCSAQCTASLSSCPFAAAPGAGSRQRRRQQCPTGAARPAGATTATPTAVKDGSNHEGWPSSVQDQDSIPVLPDTLPARWGLLTAGSV